MFTTRNARQLHRRRGMILMVVLALLTLFAIVGISFVYVANSQETSARIAREAETSFRPDVDPEAAFFYALGKILYDENDDETGIYSGLRGHSLARSAYGWDSTKLNDQPFTGVGRLNFVHNLGGKQNVSDLMLVNYTYFNLENDDRNMIRDPERYPLQYRTLDGNGKPVAINPEQQPYVPMAAVPYTYPDHNNYFLASIDPATGQIACPSFHRGYLFPLNDPNNPLWTSDPIGKYRTVRPINSYHPDFPKPIDGGGDVKNLEGVPGGADSIWIDVGAPVMKSPDGRKYKMLIAPLILGLDGRIDLNVVGNLMGHENENNQIVKTHRSNQGWGSWEINPAKVLNQDSAEWRNLFIGSSESGPTRYPGRYDSNGPTERKPLGPPLAGGNFVRGWAQADFNGCIDDGTVNDSRGRASSRYSLPQLGPNSIFGFPIFPTTGGYRNGAPPAGAPDGTPNENEDHASIYWPYNPRSALAPDQGSNRRFPITELVRILRDGGAGAEMTASDLRGLIKGNLWSGAKRRNLVTLLSADFDRPGATPYVWDRMANGGDPGTSDSRSTRFAANNVFSDWELPPTQANNFNQPIPFPEPSTFRPQGAPAGSEFDPGTWKHSMTINGLAQIRHRIDLDRTLPSYPPPNANGSIDLSDDNVRQQYESAVAARQRFADDIWKVLRSVTGAGDPQTLAEGPGSSSPEFNGLRALAQLAVNVVDYLDNDDVMSEFSFSYEEGGETKVERFYGFELPRLVINEAYLQYDNEDDSVDQNGMVNPDANYVLNFWLELMNPLYNDFEVHRQAALQNDTRARLRGIDADGAYPIYRIVLMESPENSNDDPMLKTENTIGDPLLGADPDVRKSVIEDLANTADPMDVLDAVNPMPENNRFNDPDNKNTGFYLIGAPSTFQDPDGVNTDPGFRAKYAAMKGSEDMRLKIPVAEGDEYRPRPRIVLQRLACPGLREQPDPALPGYNPFVTVDYVTNLEQFVEDGRLYSTLGPIENVKPMQDRVSVGRTQPYAANLVQWLATTPQDPPVEGEPSATFYRQNSKTTTAAELAARSNFPVAGDSRETNLKLPFDWLIHLDRKMINPIELLHVSGVAPHRVTQEFVKQPGFVENEQATAGGQYYDSIPANQHVAPWGDPKLRLYRFFEFVTVPVRGSFDDAHPQPRPMDRIMGKINLNDTWSRDVFRALADAQASNVFHDPNEPDRIVDQIFQQLMASRSPQSQGNEGDYVPDLRPTDKHLVDALKSLNESWNTSLDDPLDRPFWSLSIGGGASDANNVVFSGRADGTGVQDTLFRNNLFDVPDPPQDQWPDAPQGAFKGKLNSYQKKELLRKIFGSVTTRGNVFAVWITIGFFEVTDDSVKPVKLGKEIGRAENRHVRYRTFAIVDRTQMKAFETKNQDDFANFNAGEEREVRLGFSEENWVEDPRTGRKWQVKDDVYVVYEPNTDHEETVRVYVKDDKPHAIFQRSHPNGCRVICRGNPGPMSRYNPREDFEVVPYFTLID